MSPVPTWLKDIIKRHSLPDAFGPLACQYYLPLASRVAQWRQRSPSPPCVIAINGAQGTGKSTLARVIASALHQEHSLESAVLSIDDIYHTRETRQQLASSLHPLLATRGVPGTHDIDLGIQVLSALKHNRTPVSLPSFDKTTDDRKPLEQWQKINQPVDVILFEGWCVGAVAEPLNNLAKPVNELEQSEDADAVWRNFVNQQLQSHYPPLFDLIDKLVMLKAPDFDCVQDWRGEQEQKLRQQSRTPGQTDNSMNKRQLARFIMHYERLTRWMLAEMPARADVTFEFNQEHTIIQTTGL